MFRRNLLRAAASATFVIFAAFPAGAQMSVIDPTNLVQNALTAARTLEQINNQIRSLQNEATNLVKLGKTFAPELAERLQQINELMQDAKLVALRVQDTKDRLAELYKGDWLDANYLELAKTAEERMDASREALRTSLILQAQVTEQIENDQETLKNLSEASQDAEGALGAQQATNELLAFQAAQNMRLQNLLVTQNRADALEQARQMEALAAARAERKRFFDAEIHPGARPWN